MNYNYNPNLYQSHSMPYQVPPQMQNLYPSSFGGYYPHSDISVQIDKKTSAKKQENKRVKVKKVLRKNSD
jgi:hypothetical protein